MMTYVGPTAVTCSQSCEVPEGWTLTEVPVPRHAWADVVVCPNGECGRAFLGTETSPEEA